MNIFLTGGTGQLGHAILHHLPAGVSVTAPPRVVLDLADTDELRQAIRQFHPDLIINAAAYTAVDLAESDSPQAFLINAQVPEILAQEAQRLGAALIHFSTDYVFDGSGEAPFTETSPTGPLSVYGRSKLAGEAAIAAHCDAYWIFRTSWLYSAHGKNFLTTVLRLAREKQEVHIVDDQWGAPTWTDTIAKTLQALLTVPQTTPLSTKVRDTRGVYHLCAAGATNWNVYARIIVSALSDAGWTLTLRAQDIHPITSAQYAAPAARPANSRLSCAKLGATFGIALPAWETALAECLSGLSP